MIKTYESIPEFIAAAKGCRYDCSASDYWYGDITHDKCVAKSMHGDESLVPAAEKLLDKIDAVVEVSRTEWTPAIAGAYACVPEYLAGLPDCMRTMVQAPSDATPVEVYVSTTCSADIESDLMLKRGTAILALVLKLQQIRPVRLNLLAETHGRTDGEYLQVIRVDSAPLNLAVACHCLTHVGFTRRLTYGTAQKLDRFNGRWPDGYNSGGAPWEAHIREVLAMNPQDLYIGAARSWDDMIKDPVKWVNAQVRAFTERES